MKILRLQLQKFMTFDDLNVEWSPNINVISGENGSGKTTILKAMYSALKPLQPSDSAWRKLDASSATTKERFEQTLAERFEDKFCGVFRPDGRRIGRLASRTTGRVKTKVELGLALDGKTKGGVEIRFTSGQANGVDAKRKGFEVAPGFDTIYLPSKEMISTTESFAALYENFDIAFEETYYDLAKALALPLRKGPNTGKQKDVLNKIVEILPGEGKATVTQRQGRFYLKAPGEGEYEMGLLAEGYRKIATLYYLVANGALNENSVLFWDEPEVNLHPRLIRPTVAALVELARLGAQIFVSTHNYFVQQEFNFAAVYPPPKKKNVKIRFYSLYRDDAKTTQIAEAGRVSELEPNAIMEEFDELYRREVMEIDRRAGDL